MRACLSARVLACMHACIRACVHACVRASLVVVVEICNNYERRGGRAAGSPAAPRVSSVNRTVYC